MLALLLLLPLAQSAPPAEPSAPPQHAAHQPKLAPGAQAPALQVAKWLVGKPLLRFEPGRIHVLHFLDPTTAGGEHAVRRAAYLQNVYGTKVKFVTVACALGQTKLETLEKRVSESKELFNHSIALDSDQRAIAAYVQAAGVTALPCSFVIDGERVLSFVGLPLVVDGVLGDMLAGQFKREGAAERARDAAALVHDLLDERASNPAGVLEKIESFTVRFGMADHLRWLRYEALVQLDRYADVVPLAPAVFELARATENPNALNNIAYCLVSGSARPGAEQLALALRAAQLAVTIAAAPDPDLLDTLALVHEARGEYELAIGVLERIRPLEGTDIAALERRIEACRAKRKP
ncbi:MAG: hypothetical protein IT454_04705 [Planctomycetes bacterium]|nr:hypothetical protein [Planctomycetota bacterium]